MFQRLYFFTEQKKTRKDPLCSLPSCYKSWDGAPGASSPCTIQLWAHSLLCDPYRNYPHTWGSLTFQQSFISQFKIRQNANHISTTLWQQGGTEKAEMITKNFQVFLLTTFYHKKIIKKYPGPGWTQKRKHSQKFYTSHFFPNFYSPITMATHML